MFYQSCFAIKTLSTIQEFFIIIFCLIAHISVKIFNIDIMWFIFICYHQQFHTIFKFVIRYIDRISQTIFITKYNIDANIILLLNFTIIFFRNRKFNTFIIKIINHFHLLSLFFQDVFLIDLNV